MDNPTKARLAFAYRNLSGHDQSLKEIISLDEQVTAEIALFQLQ
jgi:hypothetical protein